MNIIYPATSAHEVCDKIQNRCKLIKDEYKPMLDDMQKKHHTMACARDISAILTAIILSGSIATPFIIAIVKDTDKLRLPMLYYIIAALASIISFAAAFILNGRADKMMDAMYETLSEINKQLELYGLDNKIGMYDLLKDEISIDPSKCVPAIQNIIVADNLHKAIHEVEAQNPDSIEIKHQLNRKHKKLQLILELWINGCKYSEYPFNIQDISEFCMLTKNEKIDLSVFDKAIEPFMKAGGTA